MHDRHKTAVATPFGACEPMRSARGPGCWRTAVGALLLLAHAERAPAQTDARALACAARVRQVADELLGVRTQVLRDCVEAALRCTTPFAATGAQAPACDAARSNRCQRRLQRIERKNTRIVTVARRCFGTVASPRARDALLGDEGEALASLAPFCPTVVIRPDSVDDALACQRMALGCTAAAAIARLAPRAPELLALVGAPDDARTACRPLPGCGDGLEGDDEECDDGNLRDGDGCSAACAVEDAVCGNGIVDDGEDCDDANTRDGDGCDADCFLETSVCGNGVLEPDDGEECDDGNQRSNDGCSDDCSLEADRCGDGIVSGDEECDDGAANSDSAPDRCRTSCVAPSCGDGVVDPDEGEGCEPPGTLLCTADCAPRLGGLGLAAGQRAVDPGEGLARCQRALVAQGVRAFGVRRRAVLECVHRVAVCVAREDADAPDADACFARAERRCAARVGRSDAVVARTAADTDARCGAPLTVANLLDPTAGLGLAPLAATCPFGEERAPRSGDVTACAMRAAACAGETAAGQVVPRAVEYLASLEFDAATTFPCLLDPTELEIGDGWFGSASGAFTGDADTTAARR